MNEFWANTLQIAIATWLLSTHLRYAAAGPVLVAAASLAATIYVSPASKKYIMAWFGMVQARISMS